VFEYLILTLGALAPGAAYVFWRYRSKWLSRIEATPVAEFPAAEPAKIVGVVQRHQTLTEAPLSGRTCVCFTVTVEELKGGVSSTYWGSRGSWSGGVPFLLADPSGTAHVDPRHAVLALCPDFDSKTTPVSPPGDREQTVLKQLELKAKNGPYYRWFRLREGIVKVGNTVAAHGPPTRTELAPNPSSVAGGYRDGPARLLTLQSNRKHKLVISSLARDIAR